MKLSDFKVLTFDCYGTLIDWENGMINALTPLTERIGRTLSILSIIRGQAGKYDQPRLSSLARFRIN